MEKRKILGAVAVIIMLTLPAAVHGVLFRNLKLGDRGKDVRELQKFLNSDADTRVAETGAGSPGNETDYFGAMTQKAVIKLQKKYSFDILTPAGASSPTGVVGSYTRSFLSKSKADTEKLANSPSDSKEIPVITSISPTVVTKSTEEVVIRGSGFTAAGNSVLISSEPRNDYVGIASPDGITLRINFHFSTGDKLKEQALNASAGAKKNYAAVVTAISQNIRERVNSSGNAQIPVLISVGNKNGTSASYRLLVDVTAILLDTGN
ncbi:MAG: peptidoglycan-binding domain-containing protein [Patescibacteria group bacterium]